MARIFLSYSRKDQDFVSQLAAALQGRGVQVSRDIDDLLPAAEWRKQLEQLIAAADTVVFVVSPDSIASEVVAWELSVVEKLNKRLAPIIWRTVANDKVPTAISKLHYIHFTEPGAFEKSLDTLVTAIDTDIGWLGEHTRLGALARRWDADGRSRSEVLRGAPLDAAERWLGQQPKAAPPPTSLHREFVAASRQSATRRQRTWIGGAFAVAAVALGLAGVAYVQRGAAVSAEAQAGLNLAKSGKLLARLSEDQARAGNSSEAINLARGALPSDLSRPDRLVVDDALAALFFAVDQDRRQMTLAGHLNAIMFAAYSPDGARILTTSSDKSARLWNARTGELIRELPGAEDAVMSGAFSPDGTRVVTTSGPLARVWDGLTGQPLFLLAGHNSNVQHIAFTPDGKKIITGGWDNTARIWNAETGEQLQKLAAAEWSRDTASSGYGAADPIVASVLRAQSQIFGGMELVAVSPDGRTVATAGRSDADAVVRLWDIDSGKLVRVLRGVNLTLNYQFLDLAFSPDGLRLAAAVGDNTARVWNPATGAQVLVLKEHTNSVQTVRFNSKGNRLLTGAMDGDARVWDATSGKSLVAIHGHRDWVNAAEFSPDDRLILTASSDKGLKLWDAETGALVADLVGHQERVLSATFSPDGAHVLSASRDKTAAIWLARMGAPIAQLEQPTIDEEKSRPYIGERHATESNTGQHVFIGSTSTGHAGLVMNVETGAVTGEVEGQEGVFVADGRSLLTFSQDGGALRTSSPDDGRLLATFPGSGSQLDRRRRFLLSRSSAAVTVSDLTSGKPIATIDAGEDIAAAVMTDDASKVVIASGTAIDLWSTQGGQHQAKLEGLDGAPEALTLSSDDARVAAISSTGGIGLWSMADGHAVRLAHDPLEEFVEADFSSDGSLLRGVRRDNTLAVWRAADGRQVLSLARFPLAGATVTSATFLALKENDAETAAPFKRRDRSSRFSYSEREQAIPSGFAGNLIILLTQAGELWQVSPVGVTKRAIATLRGNEAQSCGDKVQEARLSPAGTHLIIHCEGGTGRMSAIDLAAGSIAELAESDGANFNSGKLSFDDSEHHILSSNPAGTALWETKTGRLLTQLTAATQKREYSWRNDETGYIIDASGERALILDSDAASLWDTRANQKIATLTRKGKKIKIVKFLKASSLVATTQDDGEFAFWRASDGALLNIAAHPDAGNRPFEQTLLSDDALLLRVIGDGHLVLGGQGQMWDTTTGKLAATGVLGTDQPGKLMLLKAPPANADDESSKTKLRRLSSDAPAELRVVDIATREILLSLREVETTKTSDYERDKGPFVDAANERVAIIDKDRRVRIWQLSDATLSATLPKHDLPVTSVAFTPSGSSLATASRDRIIRVWALDNPNVPAHALDALKSVPTRLMFGRDGRHLVALLEDGTVAAWNAASWVPTELGVSTVGPAKDIAISPDGTRLMLHGGDRVGVWDLATGALLSDFEFRDYSAPAFNGNGQILVSGRGDRLTAYDAATGAPLNFKNDGVLLDVSARHALLATAAGALSIQQLSTGVEARTLAAVPAAAVAGQFSTDGNWYAASLKSGAIAIGEVNGSAAATLVEVPFTDPKFAFSPDSRKLVIYGSSSTALLIEVATGQITARLPGHKGSVSLAKFTSDGSYVLTRFEDDWSIWAQSDGAKLGALHAATYGAEIVFAKTSAGLRALVPTYSFPEIRDPIANQKLASLEPPKSDDEQEIEQTSSALSSRGEKKIASLGVDGRTVMLANGDDVQCWDVSQGKMTGTASQGASAFTSITAVAPGRAVAAAEDGSAVLWDVTTCRVLETIKHSQARIFAVFASPDARTFLTTADASSDGNVPKNHAFLWDAMTGRRIGELAGYTEKGKQVRYSPDGRFVLTDAGGTFWLWQAADAKFLRTLSRHNEQVEIAAFSPDGKRLATAAKDGTAQLTDVASGNLVADLKSTSESVVSVAFSRDGRLLTLGKQSGAIAVFDIASQRAVLERQGLGVKLRQVFIVGDRDDVLAGYADGSGRLFRLAPAGFETRPAWQDLIDFASIRDRPDVATDVQTTAPNIDGASTGNNALTLCDRLAADPYDDKRTASPVAAALIDGKAAVEACNAALAEAPGNARVRHQLARAQRAVDAKEQAMATARLAAADGYAASNLAAGVWLLAGGVDTNGKAAVEAEAFLKSAADAKNVHALNVLGLRQWQRAATGDERRSAIEMLRAAAQGHSALAHENLAAILGAWPAEETASAQRLYHLLRAASLHARSGTSGASVRSAGLLVRAQALSRIISATAAAGAARAARLDTATNR